MYSVNRMQLKRKGILGVLIVVGYENVNYVKLHSKPSTLRFVPFQNLIFKSSNSVSKSSNSF